MMFKFDSVEEDTFGNWYIYIRNDNQFIIILENLTEAYYKSDDFEIILDAKTKTRTIKEIELELEQKILSIMDFSISLLKKAITIQKTKTLQ